MIETAIIIGGGPAGMIACGTLADKIEKVILIEKNKFLGKKLRITGKGRCNITNNADIEDFIKNVPTNPRFLYSAFYSFTNTDIIAHSLHLWCVIQILIKISVKLLPLQRPISWRYITLYMKPTPK